MRGLLLVAPDQAPASAEDEPDRRIARIRLSDKTSRLRPRHVAAKRGQAYAAPRFG
jgi:hypothetical protein